MNEQNICDFISQYLAQALSSAGVDDSQASHIIDELDRDIRKRWGGDRLYVPSTHKLTKQQRDNGIIQAWTKNQDRNDIAVRYQVHRSTVDRVINRYLDRHTSMQGFGSSEWNL